MTDGIRACTDHGQWLPSLRRFLADEGGAELVEWVLLTVLVVLASMVALTAIPAYLGKAFEAVLKRFMPTLTRNG